MHRRVLILAVLALAACSRDFVSDRISVVPRGAGPDVILIPGLAGHRDAWAGVAETLDDRYRLHLVQVNGFAGFAAGANAEGPVSAPAAEEIARYIREARLERPAVIGHSMGGSIGMMLAARHPDLVGRLMVVDMMPFLGAMFAPPGSSAEGVRAAADQFRAGILADPPGGGILGQMFPTMTSNAAMLPALMKGARDSDKRTVANAFHELIVTDLRPELRRITAPVTVLYVIPPDAPLPPEQFETSMRQLYADAPNARLVKIENSRHFILLGSADAVCGRSGCIHDAVSARSERTLDDGRNFPALRLECANASSRSRLRAATGVAALQISERTARSCPSCR